MARATPQKKLENIPLLLLHFNDIETLIHIKEIPHEKYSWTNQDIQENMHIFLFSERYNRLPCNHI